MTRGRPPKGGGTELDLVRTRRRTPKATDTRAAAAKLQELAAAGGAQVFTLYGDPPPDQGPPTPTAATCVAVDFYRDQLERR